MARVVRSKSSLMKQMKCAEKIEKFSSEGTIGSIKELIKKPEKSNVPAQAQVPHILVKSLCKQSDWLLVIHLGIPCFKDAFLYLKRVQGKSSSWGRGADGDSILSVRDVADPDHPQIQEMNFRIAQA